MILKVNETSSGKTYEVKNCSKAMSVAALKKKVADLTKSEPKLLNLIFGGKFMNDECDICDYRIESGFTIQLQICQPQSPVSGPSNAHAPGISGEADDSISKEEEKRRLLEIGGSALVASLDEESGVTEEICQKCKNNGRKNCKECGCSVCGGKNNPERQLFCEQCEYFTHMECLDEPLDTIPDDDWYCQDCFNDPSQIVGKGERVRYSKARAKMPSRLKAVKRDWGRGVATAGRTKTCDKVPKNHFGPIPGIDVGMAWQYRIQASEAGVHLPPVAGIAGQSETGCQSIVLAGGYEDDEDNGDEFYYTGSGGRDLSGNKRVSAQSCDQELTRSNKAIAVSCNAKFNDKDGAKAKNWKGGKPIRVLRSYKLQKHSKFAPEVGIRYDGIYKVVKYWPQKGKSGHIVWRFLFRRDDPCLAPWEKGAKKFRCIMKEEEEGGIRKVTDVGENSEVAKKFKFDVDDVYEIAPDLLTLIKADERKKELWAECLTFKGPKHVWYDFVEKAFQCIGCCTIVAKPVNFPCNHNVCLECIKKAFENKFYECWFCRCKLGEDFDIHSNINFECDAALKKIFS